LFFTEEEQAKNMQLLGNQFEENTANLKEQNLKEQKVKEKPEKPKEKTLNAKDYPATV
jgi:hypothetical protein